MHDKHSCSRWPRAAVRVKSGQTVQVVNTHGTQVVDFWAIRADRPEIALSMQHSRIPWRNLRPHPGDGMLDEERSTIMILTKDTSPGVHDTVIAACDPFRYAQPVVRQIIALLRKLHRSARRTRRGSQGGRASAAQPS